MNVQTPASGSPLELDIEARSAYRLAACVWANVQSTNMITTLRTPRKLEKERKDTSTLLYPLRKTRTAYTPNDAADKCGMALQRKGILPTRSTTTSIKKQLFGAPKDDPHCEVPDRSHLLSSKLAAPRNASTRHSFIDQSIMSSRTD